MSPADFRPRHVPAMARMPSRNILRSNAFRDSFITQTVGTALACAAAQR